MPDFELNLEPELILILKSVGAAAGLAATTAALFGLLRRHTCPSLKNFAFVMGAGGAGFYVGCWVLGVRPNWPPTEDQDRFLLILLPAVIATELVAAVPFKIRYSAWPLRVIIAAGAVRVLLHQTSYIADLTGPNSREWSPALAAKVFGGLACALALVWFATIGLASRSQSRTIPLIVALACFGAAATIMLSGYASGGQLGFPLGAAVAGATIAACVLPDSPNPSGVIGVGVVGLFALLVMGRFFGSLSTVNAALLFLAPLLSWLVEAPPRLRNLSRAALAVLPIAIALILAQQKFAKDSAPPSSRPDESAPSSNQETIQDYLDFGK